MNVLRDILRKIGEKFSLPGELIAYEKITRGNINDTYQVIYRQCNGENKYYVFQKVNTYVFKNPRQIMKNIDRVTNHITQKRPGKENLYFYRTEEKKNFYEDPDDGFWRIMNYIESVTFDFCDDLSVIEATGVAFGEFQMQLSDLDGSMLYETIPDFHHTKKRMDQFFSHVKEDPLGRAADIQEEIETLFSMREKASSLSVRFDNGEFPVRVTHNDTKANNVLFDSTTLAPVVIIDLDTVMPGMVMYDFGDAVRFLANTPEGEDGSTARFDVAKFAAFAKGFLSMTREALTMEEINHLVLGTFSVTAELSARFLDDYITGDSYFKIDYPTQNLERGRRQLQLAKDIGEKSEELQNIILTILSE